MIELETNELQTVLYDPDEYNSRVRCLSNMRILLALVLSGFLAYFCIIDVSDNFVDGLMRSAQVFYLKELTKSYICIDARAAGLGNQLCLFTLFSFINSQNKHL